jgi:CheY-like chemotaxis protein
MATVAIVNSSDDTVEMLRYTFEQAGFATVAAHVPDIKRGRLDLIAFVEQHDPAVLVYDVTIPYAENWNFLRLVRDAEALRGRPIVVTTTNKRALEEIAGPTDAIEIVGKPYEPQQIVEAVRKALGAAS